MASTKLRYTRTHARHTYTRVAQRSRKRRHYSRYSTFATSVTSNLPVMYVTQITLRLHYAPRRALRGRGGGGKRVQTFSGQVVVFFFRMNFPLSREHESRRFRLRASFGRQTGCVRRECFNPAKKERVDFIILHLFNFGLFY